MELIITDEPALLKRLSNDEVDGYQRALADYLTALAEAGISARVYSLHKLGVSEKLKPAERARAIKVLLRELALIEEPRYLLFLGGDEVIPFCRLNDPTADAAGDGPLLSDSYYSDFVEDPDAHWPSFAIGRMPDCARSTGRLLQQQLERAAVWHRGTSGIDRLSKLGYSTDTWHELSRLVLNQSATAGYNLVLSPPVGDVEDPVTGVDRLMDFTALGPNQLLYFNLHGRRNDGRWWGERIVPNSERVQRPMVMSCQQLEAAAVALHGSIVLTQACHGAAIAGRTVSNSLALQVLSRGALAYIGFTSSSYSIGSPQRLAMRGGCDALFMNLLSALFREPMRLGDALVRTKRRNPPDDVYAEKNGLGMTLFGDPMLRMGRV